MRAAVYTASGGTEVIQFRDLSSPVPADHQIRVRVHAAGLNRADIHQRRGHYPAPPGWPADVPGLEYAGVIDALGPDVTQWTAGDRVMGLVGGGAHAECVVVHEDEVLPVPAGMSLTDAAAIPEAFLTAYDALAIRGRLQPGERVLIHAVASGLGTATLQVARVLGAAVVLGTSRTGAKLERARQLGLDVTIDTTAGSFPEQVGDSVDVILDVLGASAWSENLAVLGPRGRLIMLGFLGGATTQADFTLVLRKRLEVIGSMMRTRSLEERISLVSAFREEMLPHFTDGSLKPVVGATYPMTDLVEAHQAMERNETFGKVVLIL